MTHTTPNPLLRELNRLQARVAGLEDANRQLQRENLRFREQLGSDGLSWSEDVERQNERLEHLLGETLAQVRHLRRANRELERELNAQDARLERLEALATRQERLIAEARQDLEAAPTPSLHRLPSVARRSNPDALQRLKDRLVAQRERPLTPIKSDVTLH